MSTNLINVQDQVYVRESNIKGIGQGLFAKNDILAGSIIVQFTGILYLNGANLKNKRSNISFANGSFLECFENDLASYANDVIIFSGQKRKLLESLRSNVPFYLIYTHISINAEMCTMQKNQNHYAYLIATQNIKANDEIFVHYGFMYWYQKEFMDIGFLWEDEIMDIGFPEKVFEYPAFWSYVRYFYPQYLYHKISPDCQDHDIILYFEKDSSMIIHIYNFAERIQFLNKTKNINIKEYHQKGYRELF